LARQPLGAGEYRNSQDDLPGTNDTVKGMGEPEAWEQALFHPKANKKL
jgi:hypothetical protein